jgi:general secretion pathway protein A
VAAGGKGGDLFSRRALKRIYHYSQGLPRLINAVCDRALLAGYTGDTARISSRIADVAIRDMKRNTASDTRKRRLILLPMFVIVAAFLAAVIYLNRHDLIARFNASQPMETKEEGKNKESSVTEEEFSRAMAAELGKIPEPESAQRAFNALAGLWTVLPIPENEPLSQLNGIERAARNRKLRLHRFSGSLGALLRIDYPAVLELTFPGIPGKRFVSLVGTENRKVLIDPPIAGRDSLSFSEIETVWSGQGFILWKDPLNFQANITPASKGSHVRELQGLLREAEAYSKPLTGVYDSDTLSAVKEFQSSKGIAQDGIAGDQTLMLLYRCIDRFEAPRLTGGRK